ELTIEQPEERREAVVVQLLLEQRPTVLVERLLVERRGVTRSQHVLVRALRVAVVLLHEQRLAATELGLVAMRCLRIFGQQAVERRERIVDAALRLVRARK